MLVDQDNTAGLMFGTVSAVDAQTCRIRVRLDERDGLETHWIHVPQRNTHRNKHRSLPDLGGHASVLLAANGVDGVYHGAIYSRGEPPPIVDDDTEFVRFADGTTVSHDRSTGRHTIDSSGPVTIRSAQDVTIQAAQAAVHVEAAARVIVRGPDIVLDGNVTVTRQLAVQGGMQIAGGSGAVATVSGDMRIEGNVSASGSIMDAGGNSNHHSHD